MNFRDFEIEFNILNANDAEIYEKARDKVLKNIRESKNDGKPLSEIIRWQCSIIYDFFDEVVGVEFRKELFGDEMNTQTCLEAYLEFADIVDAQVNSFSEKISDITAKKMNREARRQVAKANAEPAVELVPNGKSAWRKT